MLKEMLRQCQKSKCIYVMTTDNRRYLSDGEVIADVTDITPEWELQDFRAAMELPGEKQDGFCMIEDDTFPVLKAENMEKLQPLSYSININGVPYQPFNSSKGILLVDRTHMTIFKEFGIKSYGLTKYNGKPFATVIVNDTVMGLICLGNIKYSTLIDFAYSLYTGLKTAMDNGIRQADEQIELEDM